jgi:protease I
MQEGYGLMKALIISADQFEDSELLYPYYRLKEEGFEVHVASISRGTITGKHGYKVTVDVSLDELKPEGYDLLILPGGKAPESLKNESRALDTARHFFAAGKPVAAICHGPLILAAAGLLKERNVTGYRSTKKELISAGARYCDHPVVVHGQLVTSRQPSDLPVFAREMIAMLRTRMGA